MKYIVQLFQNYDDSYNMFQVIFSAKSKEDAAKMSRSIFIKWKMDSAANGVIPTNCTKQIFLLTDFIKIKEQQFKAFYKCKTSQ